MESRNKWIVSVERQIASWSTHTTYMMISQWQSDKNDCGRFMLRKLNYFELVQKSVFRYLVKLVKRKEKKNKTTILVLYSVAKADMFWVKLTVDDDLGYVNNISGADGYRWMLLDSKKPFNHSAKTSDLREEEEKGGATRTVCMRWSLSGVQNKYWLRRRRRVRRWGGEEGGGWGVRACLHSFTSDYVTNPPICQKNACS